VPVIPSLPARQPDIALVDPVGRLRTEGYIDVAGLLDPLLGSPVIVHPAKLVRLIWPHRDELVTRPHQDFPYIQGAADTLTAWIPLGGCSPRTGSVRVIPRSHRSDVRPVHRVLGAGGFGVDLRPDDRRWLEIDFQPGDVLLFHAFTVHAASAHHGDRIRLSVDFRYQSASDPIAREWLGPHPHHAEPNGWADVTRGWASRRWVELPPGPVPPSTELVPPPPDGSGWVESLAIPASRFAGTPVGAVATATADRSPHRER
jgi:Phytanoyl-CoA dioxygenase (PhyH)